MPGDIKLVTIQLNLAKNNSFHVLLSLVKIPRLHNLNLYEHPCTLIPLGLKLIPAQ